MAKNNATTKKVTNETKAESKRVKSGASTSSAEREQARLNANPTKVVCPVCGTEFDVLDPHEHIVKNATVLGVDSGMGIIELPVSKRGEALKAAGIDTSKYFSIHLPTGGEQMMKMDADGKAVPVTQDDPIIQAILSQGTVPNRNLFRRWIMSQVFHALTDKWNGGSFGRWLSRHGYIYQWEMMIDELHVQSRLYRNGDMENFHARNRWFDKDLAHSIAADYIQQLRSDLMRRRTKKCKGVPYITVEHQHYFVSDISRKLLIPMRQKLCAIGLAKTPQELEDAVRTFWKMAPVKHWSYKQHSDWKDAYKGMGAYATMQNLLRFHGCHFPKDNAFYMRATPDLELLERAAQTYAGGEGWRLFGLMKQMLEENHIDIEKKMQQWAAAKKK